MNSAVLTDSAYRPSPEPPSPRWQRAASGLRWIAWAAMLRIALGMIASAIAIRAEDQIWGHSITAARRLLSVTSGVHSVSMMIGGGLVIAGLFRVRSLPQSIGVRVVATAAIVVVGIAMIEPYVVAAVTASMYRRMPTTSSGYMTLSMIEAGIDAVIAAAYVALAVSAIARMHRALGAGRPPGLTTYLVISLVLVFTEPIREMARWFLATVWGRTTAGIVRYVIEWSVSIAMTRYWVLVLRRTADLVGAQVLPESPGLDAMSS